MKLLAFFLLGFMQETIAQQFSLEKSKISNQKIEMVLQLYSPKELTEPVPLIVFLHGAGERGNDNSSQTIHGVHGFLKQYSTRKFYLLAPQCPLNHRWVETDWSLKAHQMPESPSQPMHLVFELIDSLLKNNQNIDKQRIYVCGISMGGFGTWDMLCRRPEIFAAGMPVCGGADLTKAKLLNQTPIWAFHGAKDKVVVPSRTTEMVKAIQENGGNPVMTIYEDLAHDSWTKTFSNDLIYDWLFAQRKR